MISQDLLQHLWLVREIREVGWKRKRTWWR
jgi:hypothetical protein